MYLMYLRLYTEVSVDEGCSYVSHQVWWIGNDETWCVRKQQQKEIYYSPFLVEITPDSIEVFVRSYTRSRHRDYPKFQVNDCGISVLLPLSVVPGHSNLQYVYSSSPYGP